MECPDRVAVEQARAVLDVVQGDPRGALGKADALLAGDAAGDVEAQAVAEQAAALALRELDEPAQGLRRARRAVRLADKAGATRTAALSRLSLALLLVSVGRTTAALAVIDDALPHLTGADGARARMQRGVVHHLAGRLGDAEADYTAAIDALARHGDLLAQARALNNRGYLRAYRGAGDAAQRDLDRAGELFESLRLPLAAADVRWNAAVVAAQRGAIPKALAGLAAVQAEYQRLAVPRPDVVLDHIDILLSVPLVDEARSLAEQAVADLQAHGLAAEAAEARLGLARACLADGDLAAALDQARSARSAFRRQGRQTWEASAWHVILRARVASGQRTLQVAQDLLAVADDLDQAGWPRPALEARLDAAEVLDEHDDRRAEQVWLHCARARRGGTATTRALGWYAHGRRMESAGELSAAARAWRRGLDELYRHRLALTAADLRAGSAARGRRLAHRGLRLALQQQRPAQVLSWAERWRAGALLMTRAVPEQHPDIAAALTALRVTRRDLHEAALAGDPTSQLRERQAMLEKRIRDLSRSQPAGSDTDSLAHPPTARALGQVLGQAALVELIELDHQRWAVVVAGGRSTLHRLGDGPTADHLARLGFALRRLAAPTSPLAGRAARAAADKAAGDLDSLLFGPLRRRIGDRPLVVVPTGPLHGVPWTALPTCRDRVLTVAPSATTWWRAATRDAHRGGPRVLAAGPGLPGARAEAQAVAAQVEGTRLLLDGEATTSGVLDGLESASMAHLATHGSPRADSPMFSALTFVDGPLTVYDMGTLRHPPDTVVLSACDVGRPAVRPGDEILGLAAAFLALGTRTLVATVLPIADGTTAPLMLDFHHRILSGEPPAAALHHAQQRHAAQGDEAYANAAAFVCMGTGW